MNASLLGCGAGQNFVSFLPVLCEDMDEAFALWNTVSPCGDKALAEFDLILVSLGSKQIWRRMQFSSDMHTSEQPRYSSDSDRLHATTYSHCFLTLLALLLDVQYRSAFLVGFCTDVGIIPVEGQNVRSDNTIV